MVLLAFDNTDGPAGGCTTHVAFHVLLALPELALTGMPRLVRLNPNIPWKTRGNGAVVLPLGRPRGPQVRVGELRGHEILAFPEGAPAEPNRKMLDAAWGAIQAVAQPDAQPGVALFSGPPPAAAYWQTVQSLVEPTEARQLADACGALWTSLPGERALPGCVGAAAWPGPPSSFEFVAYREPSRWKTERAIDEVPLRGLDETGATFHTFDREARRLACVPHTPDPVLCGLRGRDPDRLRDTATRALAVAAREPIDGWLLWATNQASGDHMMAVQAVADAPPFSAIAIEATVTTMPESRHGGHVFVGLSDAASVDFQAVAFEPTKSFRDVVRALRPGDRLVVIGAWESGLVKLEKLQIVQLADHQVKMENPACPLCGRSMKSAGTHQGYRCRHCHTKAPPEAGGWKPEARTLARGWHEVPIIARRHLHRPLAFDPVIAVVSA